MESSPCYLPVNKVEKLTAISFSECDIKNLFIENLVGDKITKKKKKKKSSAVELLSYLFSRDGVLLELYNLNASIHPMKLIKLHLALSKVVILTYDASSRVSIKAALSILPTIQSVRDSSQIMLFGLADAKKIHPDKIYDVVKEEKEMLYRAKLYSHMKVAVKSSKDIEQARNRIMRCIINAKAATPLLPMKRERPSNQGDTTPTKKPKLERKGAESIIQKGLNFLRTGTSVFTKESQKEKLAARRFSDPMSASKDVVFDGKSLRFKVLNSPPTDRNLKKLKKTESRYRDPRHLLPGGKLHTPETLRRKFANKEARSNELSKSMSLDEEAVPNKTDNQSEDMNSFLKACSVAQLKFRSFFGNDITEED